jgi:hypothetical protein
MDPRELCSEAGLRYQHRKETLEHAIGRFRRGYRQVTHPGTRAFRHAYQAHAANTVPGLNLKVQPDHVWEGDQWMEYHRALQCTANVRADILHKLPEGMVDLQIYGWAKHRNIVLPRLMPLLETGMYARPVAKGTKSVMITIPTPAVIPQRPFKDQVWQAELGMLAAQRLQSWYRANSDELQSIGSSLQTK